MKIFGHPVHSMLIHFPSALFPMDWVCSLIAWYWGAGSFVSASFYAMTGGTVLGVLAMVSGAADLIATAAKRPKLVKKILIHGSINSVVVIGYSVLTLIAFKHYPFLQPDNLPVIFTKTFLIAAMLGGNYIGGSLILKDRVGIEN